MNPGNNKIAGITNMLYHSEYEKPPEMHFAIKKQLRVPTEKISKEKASKEKAPEKPEKPKISEITWGNPRYGTQIVSIDEFGSLVHWDAFEGKILTKIEASKTWLISADFERTEGKKVACGTLDAKLLIFEINTLVKKKEKNINKNKPVHELVGHQGAINCCKFLNGNFLISGSTDATVCVWDLESPQRYLSMHNEHTADVLCMATYENDGNIFITGSSDLTTKIWDIRVKQPVQATFKNHESVINAVQFFPIESPTTFASGSDDSTIKLHDLRVKKEISTFQDESYESVYSITFSKTGRFIFAGTESTKVKVWDVLGAGSPLKNPFRPEVDVDCKGLIKTIAMSSDGYALAFAGPQTDGIWILY